jgi:O-antigen/teichoic acid export membrane protein
MAVASASEAKKTPKAEGESRLIHDALQVFGGQIAMQVIGIGTSVITTRALSPTDRGLFQLLVLLPITLSNFVKLGIPQASVYYIRRRRVPASDVASNSALVAFVMGGAMALFCWWQKDWLMARIVKGAPAEAVLPSLALIPFALLQFYFLGIAQAQQRFREYNIQQVVPNVLSLIGMAVTLLWLHMGLLGAVLTQAAILVFMTLWLVMRVHRHAPLHFRFDPKLARGMLSFGGKSYVQTLAATLHLRLDQYLIAYLLDPQQVAFYAIAVNIATLLLKVPDATGTALFPRLAGSTEDVAHRATAKVTRYTVLFTTVGALGFAIAGPIGIRILYGARYDNSMLPMIVLLPGIMMMALYGILTRNFTSRGKQQINIIAAGTALALNAGLNWVVIPRYGIIGAAACNGVSYSVASLILLTAFVRESGISWSDTLIVKKDELVELFQRARQRLVRR